MITLFLAHRGFSFLPLTNLSYQRFFRSNMSSLSALPSVSEFLQGKSLKEDATLSLGNPAGDADSIISALALAYIDSTLDKKPTVPIVSIPHEDLKTQRPETKYLLQLAGINLDDLIAIDHKSLPKKASVVLVDHNQLTLEDRAGDWTVTQILDHHLDERAHTDTCQDRNIAFDSSTSSALVASTCTLIAERFSSLRQEAFPPSLAILLLGVILLDSINMSPKAGKGTTRDRAALQALQTQTDWTAIRDNLPADILDEAGCPQSQKLFDTLQNQKFHPDFWESLTALQALKLDYKSFGVPNQPTSSFGVSTILQSMNDFFQKPQILETIQSSFAEVEFFGLMFFCVKDETPQRQIALVCSKPDLLDSLLNFLEEEGSLNVEVVDRRHAHNLHVVFMNQGTVTASRKQVVPILMEYFNKKDNNEL